jgi:uncharacterized protein YcbX
VDSETGLVASAKHPAKWGRLLALRAAHTADGLRVTLPDGTVAADDEALSRAVGRPVTLTSRCPAGAALERLTPDGDEGAGEIRRGTLGGTTFVDFAAVHVVTTATLAALGADARRFRPNIVVRMVDGEPFAENAWTGRSMAVGPAVLRVVIPTPRCAVPTLAHGPDLPADPRVMREAARRNRIPVLEHGTFTCVGAYARVSRPGPVRVGDLVRVAA